MHNFPTILSTTFALPSISVTERLSYPRKQYFREGIDEHILAGKPTVFVITSRTLRYEENRFSCSGSVVVKCSQSSNSEKVPLLSWTLFRVLNRELSAALLTDIRIGVVISCTGSSPPKFWGCPQGRFTFSHVQEGQRRLLEHVTHGARLGGNFDGYML